MWSTTDLLQQLELASEPELGLQATVNSGKKWLLISMLENSTFSFDRGNNIVSINVKMDGPVLEEKSYFKILGCLYLLSWIRAFTSSPLLNLPPKNWSLDSFFEVFFFLRLLCISINLSYLAWNAVVMSGLLVLTATWK